MVLAYLFTLHLYRTQIRQLDEGSEQTITRNVWSYLGMCQNLVPLVNIKIAGKWMFIPLKMVLIGIDPYPFGYGGLAKRERIICEAHGWKFRGFPTIIPTIPSKIAMEAPACGFMRQSSCKPFSNFEVSFW